MPELQDIELFKSKINSLGNEEQVLAERGEKIADVPPPEQGVPDDISALLNDIADTTGPSEEFPSEILSDDDSTAGDEDSSVFPGMEENPEELFDTDLEDIPAQEQPASESGDFNDDLGSIADLGSMFEDTEPEDDSTLMPDELVDQGFFDDVSASPEGFETAEEGDEDFSDAVQEDTGPADLPGFDAFDLPEDLDADMGLSEDLDTGIDIPEDSGEFPEEQAELDESSAEAGISDEEFETAEAGDFDISDLDTDMGLPEDLDAGMDIPEDFDTDMGLPEDLDAGMDIPEDFDTDMGLPAGSEELPEEEFEEGLAETGISDAEFETAGEGDFDISDLDDDFSIPETGTELSEEGAELQDSESFEIPDDSGGFPDTDLEEAEFSEPDAEMDEGLDFDSGELDAFDLPDELDAFEGLDETVPEGETESGDLSGFEDMDISEESAADIFSETPEGGAAESFDTAGDSADISDFDMPEDFDSGIEEETVPSDEISGAADEDFDLGSLEDISLEDELEIDTDEEAGELEDLGLLENIDETEETAEDALSEPEEFSLEDLGEEYSSLEEIEEEIIPEAAEAAAVPDISAPVQAEESDFSIEKEKLERVTETLNQLPRNLKLVIEDLIGNKGLSGKRLDNLVEKLASGASVREIAALAEKITGRKIRIPSQYERKTWEELEEEKQTFSYILKHQILPYAGKIALVSIVLFFTVFVIKKQVYDPLYSSYLYDKGYDQLENENYKASDRLFNKASRLKPFKKQFYRYAEAYIEKREYDRAEQKYITMLGRALSSEREKSRKEQQSGYFPTDKKGFLDYAALKTFYQGEYAKSDRILDDFILQKGNKWDYDALLDKIDNFLNWGEIERKQFDSAGYVLNDSLSKFGNKPELVFRKMAYYLHSGRIDSLEEKALSDIEKGDSKSIDVRKYYSMLGEFRAYIENIKPRYADSYMVSDFYRYLIDHDDIDGIEEKLIDVSNKDKKLIEPHYQLSRYWNRMEKKDLERRALSTIENLLKNFDDSHMMNNYPHSYNYAALQRKRMDIFTNNRLGKFSYNDDEILEAQRYYKKAVDRFEKYSPLPGDTASYGHIYEDLGDIYYYNAGRYNDALKYFGKAYSTGYKNDNLDYKIGFINYKNRNYSKAAENFYDISLNARENEAALFAFANASFNYGVYSPAKAYYDRVIEKMEYWREHEKVFDLDRRKDQREILESLMQVYNNQGVTLFKLAEKNRNQEYYSKSLVYLSQSSELYDTLMRDPLTMNKTLTKPLAQLNMKWILLNSGWKNMNYERSVIPYSPDNMSLDSPVIYNSIAQDLYGRVNKNLK